MGWNCKICGTYNEDDGAECIVCGPAHSAAEYKETIPSASSTPASAPRAETSAPSASTTPISPSFPRTSLSYGHCTEGKKRIVKPTGPIATAPATSGSIFKKIFSITKKIISISIVFILLAGLGVGIYFAVQKFSGASSGRGKNYSISTADDLHLLSKYNQASFTLQNDINMNGASIGSYGEFRGSLNGNFYKIYNFELNGSLFKYTSADATVENLILEDFSGNGQAIITDSNGGTISRCAIIKGHLFYDGAINYMGGVAALNGGTISECYVEDVKISCASSSSETDIGGIAGSHHGNINNCFTNVVIEAGSYSAGSVNAGGLTGYNTGGGLSNSYSRCELYNQSDLSTAYLGGISGINQNDEAYITNCFCYSSTVTSIGYIQRNGFFSKDTRSNNYFVSLANMASTIYDSDWYISVLKWDIGKWHIFNNEWPTLQWVYEMEEVI